MNIKIASIIISGLLVCSLSLHAENIKIPVGSQSPELDNISRPASGMSKSSVKSQYGEPLKENAAVGKPPISSWEYANFIVYFENDHVIDSVLKTIYHESTTTVIKETVEEPASTSQEVKPIQQKEMPKEDLDLNAK